MDQATLDARYGAGAAELFAELCQPAERGGAVGVNRFLYDLYSRRPDLQRAFPEEQEDWAWRVVDWVYRSGVSEVPIPPELLPTDWLAEADAPGLVPQVPRYLQQLHSRTPTLQEAFPNLANGDGERLVQWARTEGTKDDPVLRALFDRTPARPRPRPRPSSPGVNVIGFLTEGLGLGEAARAVITALDAAEVPLLPVGVSSRMAPKGQGFSCLALEDAPFEVDLVCLNANHHCELAHRQTLPARYTIGFWWWEIGDRIPLDWRPAFQLVDEIWAGSEHAAAALRAVSPVPVHTVRLPVAPSPVPRMGRRALGLPPGFMFLTMFDYHSTVGRKNPLGVIEAFKAAFGPQEGPVLVVKSQCSERHRDEQAKLEAAAEGRRDIVFVDGYLEQATKNAILASCDCYVSLHRAEGFGLPMAEAMHLGKPVIATGYSGNLDFMTAENSYLVPFAMTTVGAVGGQYYPADGSWAEPDLNAAAEAMREVVADPQGAAQRGQRAAADLRRDYSPAAVGSSMKARLEALRVDRARPAEPPALGEAISQLRRALKDEAGRPGGWLSALARRSVLRVLRPYSFHQQRLNERLVAATDGLLAHQRDELPRALQVERATARAERLAVERRWEARVAELESELRLLRDGSG